MALGSLIFVKSSSPISVLIRWISKGDYSHICLSMNDNHSIIIESDVWKRLKVRKNQYKKYKVVDVELNDEQRLQLLYFVMSKYHAKYDYFYVLGLGLKMIGLIKNSIGFDRRNRFMCSEIIDEGYSYIGVDLIPDKLDGDISPSDLAKALLKGT